MKPCRKKCGECLEVKPVDMFHKCKPSKDGLKFKCKACIKAYNAKPEFNAKRNAYYADYNATPGNKARRKAHRAKLEYRARVNKRQKERYKTDPKYRLKFCMSVSVCRALKNRNGTGKRGNSWLSMVDYTGYELMAHLEKLFKPWMTWENYGSDWHVDHIVAKKHFTYSEPKDIGFKECWALSNLQPLSWQENMSKGTKLDKPFQDFLPLRFTI